MNIAPYYSLVESFIGASKNNGPSFDFLFNTNSRNLYHAPLDGRFYTFHFLMGFLTTLARSQSLKIELGIEKIVVVTGKTEELEDDLTSSGEYSSSTDDDPVIDFQIPRDSMNQRSTFIKCFIVKQHKLLVRNFFFDYDDLINIKKYNLPRLISKSEIKKLASVINIDLDHLKTFAVEIDEFAVTFSPIFNDQELGETKFRRLPSPEIRLGKKFMTNAKFYPDVAQKIHNQFLELDRNDLLLDHLSRKMFNTDFKQAQERTVAFFGTMNNIFDEIYADLNIEPFYNGLECGFAHGMFSAMTSQYPITVNVEYTENFDLYSYVMTVEHRFDMLNREILEKVPIVATFGNRLTRNPNIIEESHAKDTLSKAKVFVRANFRSRRIMMNTKMNTFRGNENFLENLESFYVSTMSPQDYQVQMQDMREFVTSEMNKIRLTSVMQDVRDTNYLSRYLLGMFHAVEKDNKYQVYLVNDIEASKTTLTTFLIIGSKMKLFLDIHEYPINHEHGSHSIPRLSSSKTLDSDVIRIKICMTYEHTTQNFRNPNEYKLKDFIFQSVSIGFENSGEEDVKNLVPIEPTEILNLIRDDFVVGTVHKRFHDILNKNLEYLRTKRNYAAFVEGLFHYLPSIKNAVQLQPYYKSKLLMTTISCDNGQNNENLGERSTSEQLHQKQTIRTINFDFGAYESREEKLNYQKIVNLGTDRKRKLDTTEETQSKRAKFDSKHVMHNEEKNIMTSLTEHKPEDATIESIFYDFAVHVNLPDCETRRKRSGLCEHKNTAYTAEPYQSISVKLQSHLKILEKASSGIMVGLMVKDFANHLIQKNWKGLLEDGAFVGGMGVSSYASYKSQQIASRLLQSGKLVANKLVSFGGAVASKALSFYVIKHLVENIRSYSKDGESLVDVTTDGLFLAAETAQLTVEGLEICGLVEGIASITGPLGLALGTVAVFGSQIYHVVRRVENIQKEIYMTTYQKIQEGLSTFFLTSDSNFVKNEINTLHANQYQMKLASHILQSQPTIKRVVVQSARMSDGRIFLNEDTRVDFVHKKNVSIGKNFQSSKNIFCHLGIEYLEHLYSERYASYFLFRSLRPMLVNRDNSEGGRIAYNTFLCENSFGVQDTNKTQASATFYDLGSGEDEVLGFPDSPNYFNIGAGRKAIFGGNDRDLFILHDCSVNGNLNGLNSFDDELILSNEFCRDDPVMLTTNSVLSLNQSHHRRVNIDNIENFIGRKFSEEIILADCNMRNIDLQAGKNPQNKDVIYIPWRECSYELKTHVHSNTKILCEGSGIFYHIMHTHITYVIIHIRNQISTTVHNFVITSKVSDLKSVGMLKLRSKNYFRICILPDKCSLIRINNISTLNHIIFIFNDGSKLIFTDGRPIILINSVHSIEKSSRLYAKLLHVNASLIISSENQSLILSDGFDTSGDHIDSHMNVVHNDPVHPSHIVCSQRKNVILLQGEETQKIIDLKLKHISVYTSGDVNKITIDLSILHNQIRNFCIPCDIRLKISQLDASLELELFLISENLHVNIAKIILVDGVTFFRQFDIINAGQIKICRKRSGHFFLEPEPIVYNSNTEVVILNRDHVEYDQIVRVVGVASIFSYYKQNESNLIITNLIDHLFFHELFYCTIVIEEFFVYEKMWTLKIDFNAGEMILNLEDLHLNVDHVDDISKLLEILDSRENIFYRYSNRV